MTTHPVLAPDADLERDIDWGALPNGLTEIKLVAGAAAAVALAARYGGGSLYVPRKTKPEHPLTKLLGLEAALAMATVFGGDRIEVPKQDAILRQLRFRRLLRDRAKGASVASLAAQHGLSRRRVLQLLAEA